MVLAVVKKRHPRFYCGFCGKAGDEVFTLVAGPVVCICDECVALAQQIVTDKKIAAGATAVIGKMAKSE